MSSSPLVSFLSRLTAIPAHVSPCGHSSSCPPPLPDLNAIDVDSDYWPTMRTTIHLCPAHAHSTVVLAAGSRWLTNPVERMRLHAWSSDGSGQRTGAELNVEPRQLMQGVGYGEPAWEPGEWNVDWDARKRWQRESVDRGQQSRDNGDSRREERRAKRRTPPAWSERLRPKAIVPHSAASIASEHSAGPAPLSCSHSAADNATSLLSFNVSARSLGVLQRPTQLLTALSQAVASFDTDPPHVRAYLDRVGSYSFHDDFNWDWTRWKPTGAPWYEIQLSNTEDVDAYRLMFWDSEWVVGEVGLNSSEVRTTSMGNGLSTMVVVYEGRQHAPLKGEEFLRAPVDVAMSVLDSKLSCRYEAEVDMEVVKKRQAAGEQVDVAALEAMLQQLTDFTADAVLVPIHVDFLWQDSHYRLHCPAFAAAFTSWYVLDQHQLGPMLRVTAVQYSFKQDLHAQLYGFRTVSLPLCYTRVRHVQTSVTLGGALHGPPVMVTPQLLHDWLNHYLFLGFQHINVPDRFGSMLPSLLPYIQQGLVSWTRIPFLVPYHMPYMDQHLVVNYYLAHHRHSTDWALVLDVDELLTFAHPYFSHNTRAVRPPHASCWERATAWKTWSSVPADSTRNTSSGAQLCDSIVSEYLSLVTATSPFIRDMSLQSVPMWGVPPDTAHGFSQHVNTTAAFRAQLASKLPELTNSDPVVLHYYRRWNVSLLAFAATRLTHSQFAYQHIGDIFPYRNKGADQRPKPFFQPLYAANAHQHGVFYAKQPSDAQQQQAVQLSQARDMWGLLPDAGSAAGVLHALDEVRLEQPGHSNLDLYQLLCNDSSNTARWRFNTTVCCGSDRVHATLVCFLSASHAFTPFDLATLTPLFPILSQTRDRYNSPVYPQHLPEASLALFAPHVSHYLCVNAAVGKWPHCTADKCNIFPGLAADVSEGKEREKGEDGGMALLRQLRRKWMRGREWNYHRDHQMYWDRWSAEQQGRAYATC